MLVDIIPKLPMRNKSQTMEFYLTRLEFELLGDYKDYILAKKEQIELHFFEFTTLTPKDNYGQVYIRTTDIEELYQSIIAKQIPIHPNGHLEIKPWGQKEFALLDPDNNLLTFGQRL